MENEQQDIINKDSVNEDNITDGDNVGATAEAFFMLNLLFVGFLYIALWVLFFLKYKDTSAVSKNHLKQALIASTISVLIVIALNVFVILTSGYASATALIVTEVYLMLIIPLFMIVGILGFVKAINHKDFSFPLIGKRLGITTG